MRLQCSSAQTRHPLKVKEAAFEASLRSRPHSSYLVRPLDICTILEQSSVNHRAALAYEDGCVNAAVCRRQAIVSCYDRVIRISIDLLHEMSLRPVET
jgi:hypothetical protein